MLIRFAIFATALLITVPAMGQQLPANAQRASIISVLAAELAQAELQVQQLTKERDELRERLKPAEPKSGG